MRPWTTRAGDVQAPPEWAARPVPPHAWRIHLRENGWRVTSSRWAPQIMLSCPERSRHPHGDRHPSFSFNPVEGIGHCFACGAVLNGWQLWNRTGGGNWMRDWGRAPDPPRWSVHRPTLPGPLSPDHRQWLRQRGLTDAWIERAALGSGPRGIGIPWHDPRRSVLWVNWRTLRTPKYWAEPGAPKGQSAYGWPWIPAPARVLVVVEGELDALYLAQCGVGAVALGGLYCTAPQAAQMRLCQLPVVVWLDGDEAGQRAAAAVVRTVGDRIATAFRGLPGNPRDHDPDAIRNLVDTWG